MSKSTVISLLPFPLHEEKVGQNPHYYDIPAAVKGDLSLTVIGDASYPELIPNSSDTTPPRRIEIISNKVAAGIIEGYVTSCLGVSYDFFDTEVGPVQALPAIFWLEGTPTKEEIKRSEAVRIKKLEAGMRQWFSRLIKLADNDWNRNKSHNSVSSLQRAAATYLGVSREWNVDLTIPENLKTCPACMSVVSPLAVLCANCKFILNAEKYKTLQFANAI